MLGITVVKKKDYQSLLTAHDELVSQRAHMINEMDKYRKTAEELASLLRKYYPKRDSSGKFIKRKN